ncbi:hypothetical protein GI364_10510 [Alicyclobacillus sp. SO9]|nr:hypothetical protein GI364_10510 [Alicyclobacillus sp. SO9]
MPQVEISRGVRAEIELYSSISSRVLARDAQVSPMLVKNTADDLLLNRKSVALAVK